MAKFVSRYREHRVVVRAPRQLRDEAGRVVDVDYGKTITFHDHMYETEDPEEIAALRAVGPEIVEVSGVKAEIEPREPTVVREASTAMVERSEGVHRCDDCGRVFSSQQGLLIHKARAHGSALE